MRKFMVIILSAWLIAGTIAVGESGGVRLCVSAGQLIPETKEGLQRTVRRFLDEAQAPAPTEALVACVVPHGPYGISGPIAAAAFKHLKKGQYKRVVVLGASHAEMAFEDCSIAAVDAYATPMGFVPLDAKGVRKLCYSALFNARSMRYSHLKRGFLTESERKPLHEYEHSIEIVLPFLQEQLGDFTLIPILVGNLTDGTGRYSEKRAEAVAMHIRKLLDGETLLVVSTDFTHFGNDFSYRPFNSDILNQIDKLDERGLARLANNDAAAFEDFVTKTRVPICGLNALRVLLHTLPERAQGTVLGHTTSGRFYNDENRSVSYAAMNFYLSDKPRPTLPDEAPDDLEDGDSAPEARTSPPQKAVFSIGNDGVRSLE